MFHPNSIQFLNIR